MTRPTGESGRLRPALLADGAVVLDHALPLVAGEGVEKPLE